MRRVYCFGPAIPKKLKKIEELDKREFKCKRCVSINRSKTTSLELNCGEAVSLKSEADALSW